MAFNLGEIKAKLTLDTSDFTGAAGRASSSASDIKSAMLSVGATVTAVVGGLYLARQGFDLVAGTLQSMSQAAAQTEQVLAGLANVLTNQLGEAGAARAVESLDSMANALERLTGIDDNQTLAVSKALTLFGVQAKSLEPATLIVSNFATAMGIEATTAARLFSATLQGNAGALGRYLPQVRSLTEAQLRNGEAFRIAEEATRGQAEAMGNTFLGAVARASAAVEDLGKVFGGAFNDALKPIILGIAEAINSFTARLQATPAAMEGIRAAAAAVGTAIQTGLGLAVQTIADIVVHVQGLSIAWQTVKATFLDAGAGFNLVFSAIAGGVALLLEQLAKIPGAGFLQAAADQAAALRDRLGDAFTAGHQMAEEARRTADGMLASHTAAQKFASNVRDAREKGGTLAQQIGVVADKMGLAKAKVEGLNVSMGGTIQSAEKVQTTMELATEAIDAAVQKAASLRDTFSDAADEAAGVASAAASISSAGGGGGSGGGGGGGSGGGGDPFGRRSGGSVSLGINDPFSAQAAYDAAIERLRAVSQGGKSGFIGAAGIQNARRFADELAAQLNQQVASAQADFTQSILSELNSRGVFDAAERNRILQERLAEATRLGIIPRGTGGEGGVGSSSGIRIRPSGGNGSGGAGGAFVPPTTVY
jgi:trimeric autotransporter adhesin